MAKAVRYACWTALACGFAAAFFYIVMGSSGIAKALDALFAIFAGVLLRRALRTKRPIEAVLHDGSAAAAALFACALATVLHAGFSGVNSAAGIAAFAVMAVQIAAWWMP